MKKIPQLLTHLKLVTAISIIGFTSLTHAATTSLWQVSKNGDSIYLGGTVHVLPPSEFPLPKGFEQAYQNTNVLMLEAQMPDANDPAAQLAMMQKLTYPAGQNLKTQLSPAVYKKLSQYFTDLGIDIAMFEQFKPGLVTMMLLTFELQKAQLQGEGVDAYFSRLAKQDDKKTIYLESLDFQLSLFSAFGEDNADAFIQSNLEQMKDFQPSFTKMLAAWRSGDLSDIEYLMTTEMQQTDPDTYELMFTKRNKDWIPKLEALFNNQDKELVLVGAAHLAGKNSVLDLLKLRGYHVKQVQF
ncbi:TraB/GumN family protein [Pseudoalteromonas tunicata]|uniref:TraB/GumN family protein n=1 Tax=Pseudoalteromonas tunicata TaxID=314281 RepID=UPI00273F5889|nr:TraB/GumN family protein [Pseudoalteromonas tunicata]MDP4983373.1 TraB/GumN family protein [Pseudoalteromonas tunicata]MDP5212746.1 TraB/GumN family protein [Pseudoalteromonas tunicata]